MFGREGGGGEEMGWGDICVRVSVFMRGGGREGIK